MEGIMSPDAVLSRVEKPQSLDEQAYELIKRAILNCTLNPGEFVAEVRLAEEMGISKTPIRKAMGRLHQEGFLENVPYRGYFVADISVEDIAEIYQLRELLECHLIRQTTPLFTSQELDQLESLTDRADQALAAGSFADFVAYNREFHRTFAMKGGSQRIEFILSNLEEHVRRIIMHVLQNGHGSLLDLQRDDHRLILQAVRQRDVDQATSLMQAHLRNFAETLVARQTARVAAETAV